MSVLTLLPWEIMAPNAAYDFCSQYLNTYETHRAGVPNLGSVGGLQTFGNSDLYAHCGHVGSWWL